MSQKDLAKKLWTDESFRMEAMECIKAGVIVDGSIEVTPIEAAIEVEPIGVIAVSKCGAGSSCHNYGTVCSGATAVQANYTQL
ncbi:MAG: hypothetical protein MUF15_05760 [Acidobacteria bacterium]|jgi:hypothetical protein|nr:hypothetical protein [Acidobacteriota bacterium]